LPDAEIFLPIRRHLPGLGTAYSPAGEGPFPALLLLHGSEGSHAGWTHALALALAVRGFLAYPMPYGVGGNAWHAGDIVSVPIDATVAAMQQLRAQPIAGPKLGIYGASRGAEHALLLATLMSEDGCGGLPDAVAAHAAADRIHGPFYSDHFYPGRTAQQSHMPSSPLAEGTEKTAWTWRGAADRVAAGKPIEIERFCGPVFLSHGLADKVWSASMSRHLAERRAAAQKYTHLHLYAGEGHRLTADTYNRNFSNLVGFLGEHLAC
jgi:dipeptidyl aminopeptidase/acylaminoacyl peptidase